MPLADALLTLLVLKSNQVDLARDFYSVIGIEFVKEQHGIGPEHYAGKVGDCILEIYPLASEGTTVDASVRLGFSVNNISDVLVRLEKVGTKTVAKAQQTTWGTRAIVRDPDGRAIELYQQ